MFVCLDMLDTLPQYGECYDRQLGVVVMTLNRNVRVLGLIPLDA